MGSDWLGSSRYIIPFGPGNPGKVYEPPVARSLAPGELILSMMARLMPFNAAQVRLLAVLALINFVNFADRQVLNPLLPLLRQHFGVTDSQLGSLQTVLLIVLALASIPSGYLADRFSQHTIIAAGGVFLGAGIHVQRFGAELRGAVYPPRAGGHR